MSKKNFIISILILLTGCNSNTNISDKYYFNQYYLNKNHQNKNYFSENNISSSSTMNFTKYMFDGKGVKVGITDTIFDLEHEDLQDLKILDTYFNVSENRPNWCNSYHGTSVLGVLAAERKNGIGIFGIIPKSEFFLVSICNFEDIKNEHANTFSLMADEGVQVINSSRSLFENKSKKEKEIIGNALASGRNGKGTILVKSAGNNSQELPGLEKFPNSKNLMIVVGALGLDGKIAEFSNYGKGVDIYTSGTQIATLDGMGDLGYLKNDYARMSGTSFSAPIVTGAIAMALEIRNDLKSSKIKELLLKSADVLNADGAVIKKLNVDRFLNMVLKYKKKKRRL